MEAMAEKDRPYRIIAVKPDGGRETIADGYEAKAWAFSSATKAAVDIQCLGNPEGIDRLELENVRGELLDNYNGDKHLCIATA